MDDMELVRESAEEASAHLDAIKALFTPGAKLTLLVRRPSHPDGERDFCLSDDDLGEVIRALELRRSGIFVIFKISCWCITTWKS